MVLPVNYAMDGYAGLILLGSGAPSLIDRRKTFPERWARCMRGVPYLLTGRDVQLALQGVGTGGCISRHIWNMENLVCTHALPLPVRHGVAAPIRRGVYTHTPLSVVYTIHVRHVCLREGATHVVPYRERVCSYAQHVPPPVRHVRRARTVCISQGGVPV